MQPVHQVPNAKVFTYLTDVEGHWQYFCNFVKSSRTVKFVGEGSESPLDAKDALDMEFHHDCSYFVFGGDAPDKGTGSIRFMKTMIRFKKKYPDRVFLILGNRDIAKMRLSSEITLEQAQRLDLPRLPQSAASSQTWRAYVTDIAAQKAGVEPAQVTDNMLKPHLTEVNLLRFHQKNDMGADGDFEFHRQEIAIMTDRTVEAISDDEVLNSYKKSTNPIESFTREYLQLGQLAVILGTTLIVHGSPIDDTKEDGTRDNWGICKVPDSSDSIHDGITLEMASSDNLSRTQANAYVALQPTQQPDAMYDDIRTWVKEINTWCAGQIAEWLKEPKWTEQPSTDRDYFSHIRRGGAGLILYATPASRIPSVVYSRYLQSDGMPRQYPDELVDYLVKQNIDKVCVGHTPHGNSPTMVRHSKDSFLVVMADTSFSDLKADHWYTGDCRGTAMCEVVVNEGSVFVNGQDQKENKINYVVKTFDKDHLELIKTTFSGCGDPFIGNVATKGAFEGYFYKARVPVQSGELEAKYTLCKVNGLKYDYQYCSEPVRKRQRHRSSTRGVPTATFGSHLELWQMKGMVEEYASETPKVYQLDLVHDEVRDLANNEEEPMSMSACVGPSLQHHKMSLIFGIIVPAMMLVLGCWSEKLKIAHNEHLHGHYHASVLNINGQRVTYVMEIVTLLVIVHELYNEAQCFRYASIPFIQQVGTFRIFKKHVGFIIWYAFGAMQTVLGCISWTTNAEFVAAHVFVPTADYLPYKDLGYSDLTWTKVWCETIVSSRILWWAPHDFSLLVLALWGLTFTPPLWALFSSTPACGESQKICYEVKTPGQVKQDGQQFHYKTVFGETTTTGAAALDLGEGSGMGSFALMTPHHAAARAGMTWKEIDFDLEENGIPPDQLKVLQCLGHARSVMPRAVRRLFLESLCKNLLQATIQITLFAMGRLATKDGHWIANGMFSIGVCLVSSWFAVAMSIDCIVFVRDTLRRFESVKVWMVESSSSAPSADAGRLQMWLYVVYVLLVMFVFAFVYSCLKVYRAFQCPYFLWNVGSGCVSFSPHALAQESMRKCGIVGTAGVSNVSNSTPF